MAPGPVWYGRLSPARHEDGRAADGDGDGIGVMQDVRGRERESLTCPAGPLPAAAEPAPQVQMFCVAVLGAKLDADCGAVVDPMVVVVP